MALRLGIEGHNVRYHIHEAKTEAHNLDGLIEKTDNWRQAVKWCDYAILDHSGLEDVSDYILKAGVPAFGTGRKDGKIGSKQVKGNEFQTVLEKDRKLSKELLKSLKIGEAAEFLEFKDIASALDHLKKHKVAHVIKPELTETDSQHTYVGEKEDGSDSIGWLETLPDRPNVGKIKKIELEERIFGVEVGCASWFNGKDFIGPPNINFEHKRIASGNLGFNTGEMGTAMFYDSGECKLFKDAVEKMGDVMKSFDFRGQVDINFIVNKDGVFPLEFTMRLGYPANYIEQELHKSKWGDFLGALAKGEKYDLKFSNDWAIGAILVGEGFPFWEEGHKRMDGLPIFGLTEEGIDHVHFYNTVYKDRRFLASGCLPLIATAKGKTIKEAKEMLYKDVIPGVFFPGMYYRNDIADHTEDDLKELEEYGYEFEDD